jgi:hypothetical protein
MKINIHPHALDRMAERGTDESEVNATMNEGEQFAAKFGRTGFRRNFIFENEWRGKFYHTKQLEVFAVEEDDEWIVITIITRFF